MPRILKHTRTPKYGERVRVYRNLNNGLLSVMDTKGRVIMHADQVFLSDAVYLVRQSGREKVLKEKRKNVHAFVVGKFLQAPQGFTRQQTLGTPVKYNPYKYDSFVTSPNEIPIRKSKYATIFKEGLILAMGLAFR